MDRTHTEVVEGGRRGGRARLRLPVAVGLLASVPVLVALASLAADGWGPNLDEAANAWRSFDQLTDHRVFVGPITQATNALDQTVYDPGPALYWLLAVPTRIAPDIGPLVGAALAALVACVVACVVAHQLAGRVGMLASALGMLLVPVTLADQVVVMPIWNPYLPLLPYAATLLVAIAVAGGRLGWTPLLVGLASFVVQSHLIFAPAVALAVTAPLMGLMTARQAGAAVGRRWLIASGVVLLVLWMPALGQQLFGEPGNLGLLLRSTVLDDRPTLGLVTGLRELGAVVAFDPLPRWLSAPAPWDLSDTGQGSAAVGLLALLGVAGVAALWRSSVRRRALAVVTLIAAILSVITVGAIAQETMLAIVYLRYALYPVGMLVWAVLGLALVDAVRAVLPRRASFALVGARGGLPIALAGLGALVLGLSVWLGARTPDVASVLQGDRPRDVEAAHQVRDLVGKPGDATRVAVALPDPGGHAGVARQLAIGYELRTAGWTPAIVDPDISQLLAPVYAARPTDPVLTLRSGPAPAGARVLGQIQVGVAPMTLSLLPAVGQPS